MVVTTVLLLTSRGDEDDRPYVQVAARWREE